MSETFAPIHFSRSLPRRLASNCLIGFISPLRRPTPFAFLPFSSFGLNAIHYSITQYSITGPVFLRFLAITVNQVHPTLSTFTIFQYHNAIFLLGERFRLKKKRSIWSMAALWRFPRAFDEPVRDIETLVNRSCARADHAQNSLRDRVTVFIRHKLPARNQLWVYYSYLLGIRNSNQQTRIVEKAVTEGRGSIEN